MRSLHATGYRFVLTGAPNEVHVSEEIAARTQHRAVVLAGRTDVNQLAALFSDAALVVSGNCGPMHLAAAVGDTGYRVARSDEYCTVGALGAAMWVLSAQHCRVVRA